MDKYPGSPMFAWLRGLLTRTGRPTTAALTSQQAVGPIRKLVQAVEHPLGAELILSDGFRLVIDVSAAWLLRALAETGLPPNPAAPHVCCYPIQFSESQWDQFREILLASPDVTAVLERFPGLARQLRASYQDVAAMPFRVYGGSSQYQIYLMHPVGFRPCDPPAVVGNVKPGWHYALLSQPGGHVFSTWLNVPTNDVVIRADQTLGHFLEEGYLPPPLLPPEPP